MTQTESVRPLEDIIVVEIKRKMSSFVGAEQTSSNAS